MGERKRSRDAGEMPKMDHRQQAKTDKIMGVLTAALDDVPTSLHEVGAPKKYANLLFVARG